MSAPLRVAVCEDSRTYAKALTRVLQADGRLCVVGTYGSGEELLAALPTLGADLITMDLELPGMDGVRATERIMTRWPVPVVVVSAHSARGSRRAVAALAAGAVDVVHKGELPLTDPDGPAGQALRRRLRQLGRVPPRPEARASPITPAQRPAISALPRTAGFRAVGVAASTGGPGALRALICALPAAPLMPFLVVQHMTPGFTEGLVAWLDDVVAAPVRLAQEGTVATPGIWVAPDDAHLVIDAGLRLSLDVRTAAGRHRPAADVLFSSMAQALGTGALAVVLTGMGCDGALGVEQVLRAGGLAISQDEADAVLPSMPHAARQAGATCAGSAAAIGALLGALRPGHR